MNRAEFLETLGQKLSEDLPRSSVISNLQYYESYIKGAVQGGKTEQEVLDELGDPNLIARSIADTQTGEAYYNQQFAEDADYTAADTDTGSDGTSQGTYDQQSAGGQNAYSGQDAGGQGTYSGQDTGQQTAYDSQESFGEEYFTGAKVDPDQSQQQNEKDYAAKANHSCLITSIVLILIMIAVFAVIGSVIRFIWPVIVPVILVLIVISIFRDKRH